MKRSIYYTIFAFLIAISCFAGTPNVQPIPDLLLKQISESRAKEHLDFLASDAMRGRNTPSPELEKAAEYIAGSFKKVGLEPINGT